MYMSFCVCVCLPSIYFVVARPRLLVLTSLCRGGRVEFVWLRGEMLKWRLLRTLGISRCSAWPRISARRTRPTSSRASSVSRRSSISSRRRASRRALTFSSATSCLRTRKTSIWRDTTWIKRSVFHPVCVYRVEIKTLRRFSIFFTPFLALRHSARLPVLTSLRAQ